MATPSIAAVVKRRMTQLDLKVTGIEGVDHAIISRVRSGKQTDLKFSVAQQIAKGLDITLDELGGAPASGVRTLPLCDLVPDPHNVRTIGDSAEDRQFIESIKQHGLIQPLAVRRYKYPDSGNQAWLIVAGHRRHAALVQLHGTKSHLPVPVIVKEPKAERDRLVLQLVENMQRAELHPWDVAKSIADLVNDGVGTDAIAEDIGKGRRWVQEMASVGRGLHTGARNALVGGRISISQAIALAACKDEKQQNDLAVKSCDGKLSEDEIRAAIADAKEAAKEKAAKEPTQSHIEDFIPKADGGNAKRKDPKVCSPWYKWKGQRGTIKVQLLRFPDTHGYVHNGEEQWRTKTGGVYWDWSANTDSKQRVREYNTKTEALAAGFLHGLDFLLVVAKPSDAPGLRAFVEWVRRRLIKAGAPEQQAVNATVDLYRAIAKRLNPPEPEDAKPAAPAPKSKAIDLAVPPAWGCPWLVEALFMYHNGRQAWLCQGWQQLTDTIGGNAGVQDWPALYDRSQWRDDEQGKPFDFRSGNVVRLEPAL